MKRILGFLQQQLGVTKSEALLVSVVATVLVVGTIGSRILPTQTLHEHANIDALGRIIDSIEKADAQKSRVDSVPEEPAQDTYTSRGAASHASKTNAPRRGSVNVNRASKTQLESIPGIGPAMAERIIEARARKQFTCVEDLLDVRGIGEKKLEKMRPFVTAP